MRIRHVPENPECFGKVEVRERIRGRPLGGRLREMCGAGDIYIEELVLKFAENSRLIRA